MARSFCTLALCLLTAAPVLAQAPGDEGPGSNAGRAARRPARSATPAADEELMDEDSADSTERERGRRERTDDRRGRRGPGEEGGRFGGGMRRGNPMFEAIDVDGDGSISTVELRKAVASLKKLDADGDGNITLAEASPQGGGPGGPFGGGPGGPFGGGDAAAMVDDLIRQFDQNKDGRIGLDEVADDDRALGMLRRFRDPDGNLILDRQELLAGMEQMRGAFGGGGEGGRFGGGGFDARQMTERMMANDRDGDGKLSADEVPQQARGMLQGGDKNDDGFIDAAEMEQITRRMGDRFGGGRGGERGPRRGGPSEEGDGERGRRPGRQRPEAE